MAKDIKQVVDFDVSRGANALKTLTKTLQDYNLTIDQVAKAQGGDFNKSGKVKAADIEVQIDATKKLVVAMKLEKNTWEAKATVIKSNVDMMKLMRAETERYIALAKNLKNAGVNTGLAHGPGFVGAEDAQQALQRSEEMQRRQLRLGKMYADLGLKVDTDVSLERLRIMEAEVRAYMAAAQRKIAIDKQRAEEYKKTLRQNVMKGIGIDAEEKAVERELAARAKVERQYQRMLALGTQAGAAIINNSRLSQKQMENELKVMMTVERAKAASLVKGRQEAIQSLVATGKRFLELSGLMKGSNDQLTNFMVNLQQISKVVWFSVLYSQMYRLIFAFREGMHNAVEFERRLAEIQTITQANAKSTHFWSDAVRSLSDQMGNPILDTAEGIYEAISNQIVQGGENTHFFNEELKLALITVSSFEDAVNTTSSVINSFNMSANDAASINAILFKTVDLGRVRLNEMANSMGRVNVLSDALGISFIEQQAAILTLTQSGLKWNVAQTFYGNILQKLIRPSERMKEIFAEWGVTSGEAAIKTFGWVNILKKLEQEAKKGGDEMAEIGEILQRIRAITGFTTLNQEKMNAAIREMKDSAGEANKAFLLINENIGQKMRVELNKIKNIFTVDFGRKLLETTVQMTERFGGLAQIIKTLINVTITAVRMYATFRVSLLAVNAALLAGELVANRKRLALAAATIATHGFSRALKIAKIEMAAFKAAAGDLTAIGLTLLIEAFVQAHHANQRLAESIEEVGNKSREASEKYSRYAVERFIADLKRREDAFNEAMDNELKVLRGVMAILNKENTALMIDLEESFKLFAKDIDVIVKPILNAIQDEIKATENRIDALKSKLEKIKDVQERMKETTDDAALDRRLALEKDAAAKVNIIWEQAARERSLAREAIEKDDLETAEKRIKRAEKLEEKALERLDKIRDEKAGDRVDDKIEKAEERAQKKIEQLQIDAQRAQEFAQRRGRGRNGRIPRSTQMEFAKKREEILEEYNKAVALGEKKEDIEKKATEAATTRKKIEEDIVAQNKIYSDQVEALRKRTEEQRKKEQKDLKAQQDLEIKLKKELDDVEKFDPKKDEKPADMLKRFDKETNDAIQKLMFDPAVTEDQILEFERKVQEQRKKIIMETERQIGQAKAAEAQKELNELTKRLQEFQQKKKDAFSNVGNAISGILPEAGASTAKIKESLNKFHVDPSTKNTAERKAIIQDFVAQRDAIKILIEKADALKKSTNDALAAGNTELAIKNFEKYKKVIEEITNKTALLFQNFNQPGVGKVNGPKDKDGKMKIGDQNIDELFADMQQKMVAFATANKEFNDAQRAVLETNEAIIQVTHQAVNALPAEYRAAAQAALDAAKIQEEANKSVAASLQLIIDKLYEVIKLNDDLKHGRIGLNGGDGAAFGRRFAFGGGADTMMGMFRPGETVMNPQSSRIFEPVLAAIQRTRTINQTASSSVINVGDININGNGADGGNAAFDQFLSRVKRAKRRGQI